MSTPKQQLRAIRDQLERDLKRKDRETLRRLRENIRNAKKRRQERKREVAASCRASRRAFSARAKKARERLNASIRRTRERAKGLCATARGEAQRETLEQIERAVSALDQERALQRQLRAWTKPKVCPTTRTKREARQESDCEVQGNIEEPGLRVVWEQVKGRIKGSARRSRTEAFYEWVAEHPAEVYAIQERDTERAIEALEREEQKMRRELARTQRYRKKSPEELRALLADVPF